MRVLTDTALTVTTATAIEAAAIVTATHVVMAHATARAMELAMCAVTGPATSPELAANKARADLMQRGKTAAAALAPIQAARIPGAPMLVAAMWVASISPA